MISLQISRVVIWLHRHLEVAPHRTNCILKSNRGTFMFPLNCAREFGDFGLMYLIKLQSPDAKFRREMLHEWYSCGFNVSFHACHIVHMHHVSSTRSNWLTLLRYRSGGDITQRRSNYRTLCWCRLHVSRKLFHTGGARALSPQHRRLCKVAAQGTIDISLKRSSTGGHALCIISPQPAVPLWLLE